MWSEWLLLSVGARVCDSHEGSKADSAIVARVCDMGVATT